MNRKEFVSLAACGIAVGRVVIYGNSNDNSMERVDKKEKDDTKIVLTPDERQILFLASMAPSGHNAQPWLIVYVEPYHWIVCSDKNSWLPGVDPHQRETILSIGAFVQNLEYAANDLNYTVEFSNMALTNQDKHLLIVKLNKTREAAVYNVKRIERRRTLRDNYLAKPLKKEDQQFLFDERDQFLNYIPNSAKEYSFINEQTIKANTIQAYRDDAQEELANWIRFSSKDEQKFRSGLTTESMELKGITAWYLRHFYSKQDVMKGSFREKNIENVRNQVLNSAGWLLITSKGSTVSDLVEAGKRMERLFLKVRERGIALHPMSQVLEEEVISKTLSTYLKINNPIQFVIRLGYVKDYPEPVSLRRPIDWFIRDLNNNKV